MCVTFSVRDDGFIGSIPVYSLRDTLDKGICNNDVGIRTTLHTLCQPKVSFFFFFLSLEFKNQKKT